jgi:hypothetical protein
MQLRYDNWQLVGSTHHHPAMSFLVDPLQNLFARRLVRFDNIVILIDNADVGVS